MSLALAAGLLAVTVGGASAQSFNSFDSNHVILLDGYTFTINGNPATMADIGTSGTYEFGFANGTDPIRIQIVSGSIFGPAGTIVEISAVNEFGLVAPNTSNLTFNANGSTITNYDNTANDPWDFALSSGNSSGGVYSAANFGTKSNNLVGDGEHTAADDARFGDFDFFNVSYDGPIYLASHFRQNGTVTTAPFIIDSLGGGTSIVPEGSSMAMLGCGALPLLGIIIRRRRNSKA